MCRCRRVNFQVTIFVSSAATKIFAKIMGMSGKTFRCGRPSQRCGRPSQRRGVGQVRGVACTLQGVENAHSLQPLPPPSANTATTATPFPLSYSFFSLQIKGAAGGTPNHTTEKEQYQSPLLFHDLLSLWQVASCLCWLKRLSNGDVNVRSSEKICIVHGLFCLLTPQQAKLLSLFG